MFTGVQRPVLKFSEICTFSVLYKAYLAARRGKRSRAATANYEVHLLANIVNLVYILQTKIYRPGLFRVFYVYEPKKRLVQAPAFVDKVVQHALVDNLIYERITNSFILDNYASPERQRAPLRPGPAAWIFHGILEQIPHGGGLGPQGRCAAFLCVH